MLSELDQYLVVGLTGLLITYSLTPMVRAAACRYGVVDQPNERRPHEYPTARGGGLAVVIGVNAACLMAVVLPWPKLAGGISWEWWQRFATASALLATFGIVDDIRGLKPWVKLSGQILAALLMFASGTRFGQLLGRDLPLPLDGLLVVLWLVTVINAFNLIDGLDGLASGLAIISAAGLCGILINRQNPAAVLVLFGFMGACLGFLRYNFRPASIFLGDTGSMFLGFTLGVVSLQTLTKNSFLLSLTIPLMLLGIPLYDALLAVWRRSVRLWLNQNRAGLRNGIMQPDIEHLHHRLLKAGLTATSVATLLCMLNASLVVVGLLLTFFQSRATGIFLIALLVAVYVLMRHLAAIELRETGRALLMGLRRPTHSTLKALAYPICDMLWLTGSLAFIMWEVERQRVGFWHNWFLELPVWVTPTFSLLALSRTYITHWPRARLRDVLMLVIWLQSGLLFGAGLALLINPAARSECLLRALLIVGISHPVIIGSRLVYRCTDELVIWLKRQSDEANHAETVLLYGAGLRAQLFLKERAVRNARTFDQRRIAGFLDDETALHFQWVYGYLVLGGLKDLHEIVRRHHVQRIILTTDLLPQTHAAVTKFCAHHGIVLCEWSSQERQLSLSPERISRILQVA